MNRKISFFMCYMLMFQYIPRAKQTIVMNLQVIHFHVNDVSFSFPGHSIFRKKRLSCNSLGMICKYVKLCLKLSSPAAVDPPAGRVMGTAAAAKSPAAGIGG